MSMAAGTRFGRYEIRSKLGEGGMGEVYLADDTRLNLELDPFSLIINTNYGRTLFFKGDEDAAIQQYKKSLEIDSNFRPVHLRLIEFYEYKGMFDEADEALAEQQKVLDPNDPDDVAFYQAVKQGCEQSGVKGYRQKALTDYLEKEVYFAILCSRRSGAGWRKRAGFPTSRKSIPRA